MAVLTDDQRKVMNAACMERIREKNSTGRKKPCSKTKKGGGGGKGTWGSHLDQTVELRIHPDDPNYDSEEEPYWLVEAPVAESVEEFKGRVQLVIDEYFVSSNIDEAAQELRDLGCPDFHHYFVCLSIKCLSINFGLCLSINFGLCLSINFGLCLSINFGLCLSINFDKLSFDDQL